MSPIPDGENNAQQARAASEKGQIEKGTCIGVHKQEGVEGHTVDDRVAVAEFLRNYCGDKHAAATPTDETQDEFMSFRSAPLPIPSRVRSLAATVERWARVQ